MRWHTFEAPATMRFHFIFMVTSFRLLLRCPLAQFQAGIINCLFEKHKRSNICYDQKRNVYEIVRTSRAAANAECILCEEKATKILVLF